MRRTPTCEIRAWSLFRLQGLPRKPSTPPICFQFQSSFLGQRSPNFSGTIAINDQAQITYLFANGKAVPPDPADHRHMGVAIGLTTISGSYPVIGRRRKLPLLLDEQPYH